VLNLFGLLKRRRGKMEEKTEIENIVRIGRNNEIRIPLETWKTIDTEPGDYVQFLIETRTDEGDGDYDYLKVVKHPTSNIEIPTEEYYRLQDLIDKKDMPYKTVEEGIIYVIKKMLEETVGKEQGEYKKNE